jgi:hypothetical protein
MTPWNDYAVAVERRRGEPVVLCEGTLAEVVAALCAFGGLRFAGIRVALIDRGARPYTFEGRTIEALARDTTRPRTSAARLLPDRRQEQEQQAHGVHALHTRRPGRARVEDAV